MNVVNSVIAGIANEQPPAPEPEVVKAPEQEVEKPQEQPEEEGAKEPEITEAEKERRKLENALKYQRKQRSQAQKEAQETRQRLEQLEKQLALTKPKTDDAPKEESFNSYSEYLEAKQEYLLEKKLAERDVKARESQAVANHQAEETKRLQSFDKASQTFEKEVADASQVFEQNIDSIREIWTNEAIRNAILKAENAPLALYNLAKEGKLEELADMDAIDAAVEIRLAARSTPPAPKKQTNAPAPFSTPRGVATAGKDPLRMSPNELLKSIRNG